MIIIKKNFKILKFLMVVILHNSRRLLCISLYSFDFTLFDSEKIILFTHPVILKTGKQN